MMLTNMYTVDYNNLASRTSVLLFKKVEFILLSNTSFASCDIDKFLHLHSCFSFSADIFRV